ncbi:acyl-CoA thioesterase [Nocardia terpenica]|uniref:acyl-CoA thioesterase n=1 Tax=Nocardia terpenica TaxID=455432 RepID=UPI0018963833|nr:acyl-CoA thioesterase [Nocardia terpenica]MBF6059772.1 acyl-CoA thioesterase [Nocardia terpenica]MBF6102687.1 acyl-CoA thioesterase [Nocardia terpenica]MBF6111122.1 acyl-CoA thioesterase [Nocardia terpenica]MBF6117253.1 acyl-CoA thioesterase [Nocardia terpenica]MBF6150906.1 acyl-CoA thioesterase [Nocardia terpenica]
MATSLQPFSIRLDARVSDVDPQLHVTGSAYQQYADHARFECVQAAGIAVDELLRDGLGPVNLETTIRYHRELRAGDCVDVTCVWLWSEGKTYRVEHALTRADGELSATVSHLSGLLDLRTRRLIADPAREWARRAADPTLLCLPAAMRMHEEV